MILVRKKPFQTATKSGFKCKDHYIRTCSGNQYVISDEDYIRMNKFMNEKIKLI